MSDPWDKDRAATQANYGADPWNADRTPAQKAARYAKAMVAGTTDDNTLQGQAGNLLRSVGQGLSLGFSDEMLGANDALAAGALNLAAKVGIGKGAGFGMGDAYKARVEAERAAQDQFATRHPGLNAVTQIGAGALLPGVGLAARGAAAGGMAAVRGAALEGAAVGGAYGLGSGTGDLAHRAPGAAVGAATGAVGGAAIAGAAGGVSRVLASRAATRTPSSLATRRMAQVVDPEEAAKSLQTYQDAGVTPTLADLGGPRTLSEMRGMGVDPNGQARSRLLQHARTTSADVLPGAIAASRDLSPYEGTATQLSEQLDQARRQMGREDYAPSKVAPIQLTPEAVSVFTDEPGQAAINQTLKGALVNRDADLVNELTALKSANPENPPAISASALDQVRQTMRDMGQGAMRGDNPDRYSAMGYKGRVSDIDSVLDAAPGLTDARARQRTMFGAIDAANGKDTPDLLTTDPRDYADFLAGLTPQARLALGVHERGQLADTLGGKRPGLTGNLQGLGSTYGQENVPALFGDRGSQFLANTDARLKQNANASFMSPNGGSRTAYAAADGASAANGFDTAGQALRAGYEAVGAVHGSPLHAAQLFSRIADHIRTAGVSPETRDAFVQLGLSKVGSPEELQKMLTLADKSAEIGRQAPRRVRDYVSRAKGVLGPANPLAAQLEQRLLQGSAATAQPEDQTP